MQAFLCAGYAVSPWDGQGFLDEKNQLLQAASRSRSHGALWLVDEFILRLLRSSSMYLNAYCFASSLVL